MIDKLKDINNSLIDSDLSDEELNRQLLIRRILNEDGFVFKLEIEVVYQVLRDLKIKEDEIRDVYKLLLDDCIK